jgi:predicted  nucleic acid-binding Zn-ribbon protein
MAKAKRPRAPRLERIVEPLITPGSEEFLREGKPLKSGPPGSLLMLVGSGFGRNSTRVVACFGDYVVEVFPPPLFSDTQVLVTAPVLDPGAVSLRVQVAGTPSNARRFTIKRRPVRRQQPGDSVKRFVAMIDPFIVLLSSEIRVADFGRFATRQFQDQLAGDVLEVRRTLLDTRQRLETLASVGREFAEFIEVKDERDKEFVSRIGLRVAQRSLLLFDQFVDSSQVLPRLEAAMARIRQGGTTTATKTLEIAAEAADLAADLASSAESGADSFSASVSAGIVVASGDTSFNPAVAIAAGIAAGAQAAASAAKIAALLSRNADEARQEQEEEEFRRQIELKLDRLEQKADRAERKLDTVEGKLDRNETKKDKIEGKLDKVETKLDRMEEKLDKNEIKKDVIESKLDRLEPKVDRVEAKLDQQENKADRAEQKLDLLEGKADREEGKLDQLESKADRAEGKLDQLESKADQAEGKLDQLESKADQAEGKLDQLGKLDKLEGKADKAEKKLDKIEPKLDKIEPKLDKLEPKIDKIEPKLDLLQIKADKSKEFWQIGPETWSVSNASRAGVRVDRRVGPIPDDWSFNVESIHVPGDGVKVVKIIVDGVETDISTRNVTVPANVLVSSGVVLVGASESVLIEFDQPYTGRLEFNGEKPQAMRLCSVVAGAAATQTSPNPCQP